MSDLGDSSANWLDDELRRVPVPDGLLKRLRHVATASDDQLDAALRHVPIPAGLLWRLRRIADLEHGNVAAELRDVEVPSGLVERLLTIAAPDDAQLDFELRETAIPGGFGERLEQAALWAVLSDADVEETADGPQVAAAERAARGWDSRRLAGRFSLAASVAFLLMAGYVVALGAFVWRGLAPSVDWTVAVGKSPLELIGASGEAQPLHVLVANVPAADGADVAMSHARFSPAVDEAERLAVAAAETASVAERRTVPWHWFSAVEPSDDAARETLWNDAWTWNAEIMTSNVQKSGPLPRLVVRERPKGMAPRLRNANLLLFQLQHKVRPVVTLSPTMQAADPRDADYLRCPVPLSVATDSYDLAWELYGHGKLPAGERSQARARMAEARPEEFVAAMDYGFSPPRPGELAIRTAAGVAPFGQPGARLLQVAVQCGDLAPRSRPPVQLVVVVDTAQNGAVAGNLPAIRQALVQWIDELGDDDLVSLVTLGGRARLVIDEATRADAAALKQGIESLDAASQTNLVDGLRIAVAAIRRTPRADAARRIVLLSDGFAELRSATLRQTKDLLSESARSGITLSVVDLGARKSDAPSLRELAEAGRGSLRAAASAAELRGCLVEVVAGRSAVLADDARLTLTLNPRSVASYRLIGHEAPVLVGPDEGDVAVRLRAGEIASALVELELRGNDDPLVATAELSWRLPGRSETRLVRQPISRWQFAESAAENPPSLQVAALAAETAEVLRRSPFAPANTNSLARVREVAMQSDPAVFSNPSVVRLLGLIERLERSGVR